MNPAPRPASATLRSYENAPSTTEAASAALLKDDRRADKNQELEPDWEALKDTATD